MNAELKVGGIMYLARDITVPAYKNLPAHSLGKKADKVLIKSISQGEPRWYTVESISSNPGKEWCARGFELMFTPLYNKKEQANDYR